jgi:CRISPR-associated protein Csd1
MVRDWLEGEFTELVRNINQWFDDLQMVWHDGARIALPPRFISVLQALTRDVNELPTPLVSKLWRVAVRGEEIPYQVLAQSISRRKVEILQNEEPNVNGMALIRAYHLRKYRKEGNKLAEMLTGKLNKQFPGVAYQCGRLMAVLAELQRRALGDVGAGVVQRYYTAASATPALVLGRLTSNSQHHLSKLDAGLARRYEDKIGEIWSHIREPLPRTLTLEEQSLFALGYYHQLAGLRLGKSEDEKGEKED